MDQLMLGDYWGVGGSLEDRVCNAYEVASAVLGEYDVLVGGYWSGSYSGKSWLLLRRKEDGELFEVHGSHCSCNGLEGQFEPSRTSLVYLRSPQCPLQNPVSESGEYMQEEDRKAILAYVAKL